MWRWFKLCCGAPPSEDHEILSSEEGCELEENFPPATSISETDPAPSAVGSVHSGDSGWTTRRALDTMEAEAQERRRRHVVKFGDSVVLNCVEFQGFVSADTKQTPQARIEELVGGVESPPNANDCKFEIRQRYQYSSKKAYTRELERLGHGSEALEDLTSTSPTSMSFTWFGGLDDVDDSMARLKNPALNTRHPSANAAKKLGHLRDASLKEQRGNDDEFIRLVGEPVLYGQVIQLRHTRSNKYLTIKRTAADVERGALKVVLFEGGTQGSWFKVVSGFRTKMDGDKCLFGDLIALESSTFNGMGMHVSAVPITEESMQPVRKCSYVSRSWELTASPDVASWKVTPYALHPSLLPPRVLQGYTAVTLIHKTSNNLMLCDQGKVIFQSVLTKQMMQGNAIFQVEPVDIKWGGMAVKYEMWVRLKNIVSNTYLCGEEVLNLEDSGEVPVALTTDYNKPGCIWKLKSFTRGGGDMLLEESFAYISNQHGLWISQGATLENVEKTKPTEGGQSGLDEIQDTYGTILRDHCQEKDVIAISQVDGDYVMKLVTVRRCLEIVSSFSKALKTLSPLGVTRFNKAHDIKAAAGQNGLRGVFTSHYSAVEKTIEEMIGLIDITDPSPVDVENMRAYQSLAQETRLIDAILVCLGSVDIPTFFGDGKETSIGRRVLKFGTLCHKFLQCICAGNPSNQKYVGTHHDVLIYHLGGQVKAADTMAAIYEGNMEQIQNVKEDIIIAFTNLIKETGFKPRYVNFFRTICGAPDRPVPKNQNWLLDHLFKDPLALLFPAGPDYIHAESASGQERATKSWVLKVKKEGAIIHCGNFVGCVEDVLQPDIFSWNRSEAVLKRNPILGLYIYYIFTLHLFRALCFGRNTAAHDILKRVSKEHNLGLEFAHLTSIINDLCLPYTLRTAALNLSVILYVDVDPYHPLKFPKMTRLLLDLPDVSSTVVKGEEASWHGESGEGGLENKGQINQLVGILVDMVKSAVKNTQGSKTKSKTTRQFVTMNPNQTDSSSEPVGSGTFSDESMGGPQSGTIIPFLDEVEKQYDDLDTVGSHALMLNVLKALRTMFTLGVIDFQSSHTKDLLLSLQVVMREIDKQSVEDEGEVIVNPTVISVKQEAVSLFNFTLDIEMEDMLLNIFQGFVQYHSSIWDPDCLGEIEEDDDMDLEGFDIEEEDDKKYDMKLLKKQASIKVFPTLKKNTSKDTLASITERLVKHLSTDGTHGLAMFKLDPLKYGKMQGPVMDLLGVASYEAPSLRSHAFQLIERLLSKRKKIMHVLINTHIIPDEDTAIFYQVSKQLLEELRCWYRWVGSSNKEKRSQALTCCKKFLQELIQILTPNARVKVTVDGTKREVLVTTGKAMNFQSVMFDAGAHDVMLAFLKLPMRRLAQFSESGSVKMDVAEEPARRELFGYIYTFLKYFTVISTTTHTLPNPTNQEALFEHVDLYLSHTGIEHLNVADTISSLFIKNPNLASKIGQDVVRKCVRLVVEFGEKTSARWLRLLQALVVVDGKPIKENQSYVLRLAAQFKEEFCCFFAEDEAARQERLRLLKEEEHLKNVEEGPHATGSRLGYHKACVELIAACCVGKDTTSVVKASDFLSFQDVMDTLLLYNVDGIKQKSIRFVTGAFWRFFQLVYLATDTESTRRVVRSGNNSIWLPETQRLETEDMSISTSDAREIAGWAAEPLPPESSCRCLMEVVLGELQQAANEPQDALSNRNSATAFLADYIFPALEEYFRNHYLQHLAHLEKSHERTMMAFVEALKNYTENLCRLQASNFGIRHERVEAVRSAKALLNTIAEVSESVGLDDYQIENEEGSVSKHSAASAITMKFVAKHWESFYMAIGDNLGVSLMPGTQEPVEERTIKDYKVSQASLFLTANILAQPWGSRVPGVTPTMYFENVVEKLANLLANHYDALPPSDAFLCKMIRVLRAAVHIDDGQANSTLFKITWHDVVHNSTHSFSSRNEELAKWAQCKYNRLGVTKAAIVMIGHPRVYIQLEAIRVLISLLEGGNQDVQDELYSILSSGGPASLNLFTNFKAAIQRCAIYSRTHGTRRSHENDGGGQDVEVVEVSDSWNESEDEDELWETKVITLNNAGNDFAFTMDVLRCMQLMAEGHHTSNQRLLCSQPENSANNDMISEVVGLLMSIQNNIMESFAAGNTENPKLAIQCLEFLQEMVQGPCKSNQLALTLHTSFLLVCNRMFGYMEYETEGGGEYLGDISLKSEIKVCLLLVLYSTLEGVTEGEIPERMIDVLDMNTIQSQVKHLFTLLGLGTNKGSVADSRTRELLKTEILQHIFFLEKLHTGLSLNDSLSEQFDDPLGFLVEEENTHTGKKLAKFIDENLGTVEVLWNGKIERAFFNLTPVCQKLAGSRVWKRDALQALHDISPESRSNPVMKGIELVTAMEKIVLEIDLESHLLKGRGAVLLPIIKQRGVLQECAAYIAVGILTLLGLTYGKDDQDWKVHKWSYWIVFALCVVEVVLSILVCLIFYFHDFQKMTTMASGKRGKMDFGIKRLEGRLKKSFAMGKREPGDKTDTNEESAVAFGIPAPPHASSTTNTSILRLDQVFLFLSYWKTWYILALFFSTIGGVVHSPFYMTFHVTFFFVEFEAGKMMMEAMSKSGTAILRTAVLGILSIFMFSVVTFLLFNEAMSEEDTKPCTTFFQCVGAHLIAGIYGDISSLFTEHLPGDVPDDVDQHLLRQLRSFFVVSFFMFWTFMLSNIFTGLIADAFGAIRDDKNTVQTDSDSRCLVCSIDRFTLDNSGKGFEHHTEYEHNPLAYVFYLHYLRSTASDRYTGYDSSVAACIKEGGNTKANWLPINRAFALENLGDSDKEERHKLIKKLDHLWQGLKSVESRLKGLEERGTCQETNEE